MTCESPASLFDSWPTLWTCLTVASVATVWSSLSTDNELAASIDHVMELLDGSDISRFGGERVLDLVQNCSAVYDGIYVIPWDKEYAQGEENATPLGDRLRRLGRLCTGIYGRASNDISGPGVSWQLPLASQLGRETTGSLSHHYRLSWRISCRCYSHSTRGSPLG